MRYAPARVRAVNITPANARPTFLDYMVPTRRSMEQALEPSRRRTEHETGRTTWVAGGFSTRNAGGWRHMPRRCLRAGYG